MPTTTPRILIVATGDPDDTINPAYRRPLIWYMDERLKNNWGYQPTYAYAVSPFDGTCTKALEDAIGNNLNPKPDIILTIASAATKAAKHVVRTNRSATGIPIVFTVVSRPERESTDPTNQNPDPWDPICPPPPRQERITGVSRDLVGTASAAVQNFAACLNNNCNIHWCRRPNLYQATEAENVIGPPPTGVSYKSHKVSAKDCNPFLQIISDSTQVGPNPLHGGVTLNGLFLIADDLVGSCADAMISVAQDPSRRIPAFVQQLEYVCPALNPKGAPPRPAWAMGGYGVKPQWVGENAADCIGNILQNVGYSRDYANGMKVLYPSSTDFLFLINDTVANNLDIGINVKAKGATLCSKLSQTLEGGSATKLESGVNTGKRSKKGANQGRQTGRRRRGR